MANYVLVYTGGGGMADSETAREQIMQEWGRWFGSLGDRLVDGGNPFGQSTTVTPRGVANGGAASGLTGYSIIRSDRLQAAAEAARGCPILAEGGSIDIYETFQVV